MKIRHLIYILSLLFILSACGEEQPSGPQVTSFSFIDQDEQPFGTEELQGDIWIASFIFTNCNTVCPPMMSELATLQEEFEKEGLQVQFVSFSVDPEVDSPEMLKEYIQKFTDDETNWHMLTGYSQAEIERFANEQFQTIVQKPDTSHQVIHGTNFYLVDDQGRIFKEYNYIDENYIELMMDDIKQIQS